MIRKFLLMVSFLALAAQGSTVLAAGDDVTIGDNTNRATFKWSGSTLTVTGKGKLEDIKATTGATFTDAAVGNVYENNSSYYTSVTSGEAYNASNTYFGRKAHSAINTGAPADNSFYSVATAVKEGYDVYECEISNNSKADLSETCIGIKLTEKITDNTTLTSRSDWNYVYKGFAAPKDGHYNYCLVKCNATVTEGKTSVIYQFTSENIDSDGNYNKDGIQIIPLTPENRDSYLTFGIQSKSDQLYAPNTTETTVTESYYELTNSTDIEGTELIKGNTTFVEFLNKQLESKPTTVIFNSEDSSNPAEISNAITRALVKCSSITTLNLEDTYLESIKGHNPTLVGPAPNYAPTEDPTFYLGELGKYGTETNKTLTTLYMPSTKNGSTLALEGAANSNNWTVFQFLTGLQTLFLSEGIETIDEYALKVGADNWVDGVNHKFMPTNVILPNTLKNIKAHAFDGQTAIETFVFPANMKYIQEGAFQSANPKDVYFLGVEAPKVEKNAWGDNSYISNNSLNLEAETSISDGGEVTLKVKLGEGVATRNTYNTKNGWMTMLHYPAACTKEQAAKYTDITRKYVKIDYGTETDLVKSETNNNVTVYAYTPGKETSEITGKTEKTTNAAQTKFFNRYNDGTSYSGDYNGGYDDIFLGAQYIWPSMPMAYRATVVAQNNLLWDGVTSIAQGIKNAGGSYSGDGTDYIGLHQFVFAQADVTATDTKKWTIASKYGDGKWHTICLPFDMTKAQMKEAFGPTDDEGNYNIRLCRFNKVLRVTDTENDRLKLYFNDEQFTNAQDDATVLKAHVSYMIKAGKENAVSSQEIVMKNYILASGSPLPTSVNVTTSAEEGTSTQSEAQYYFIGNYTKDMRIPQYTYFFSKATGKYRFEMGTSTGTNPTSGKWNAYSSVVEASDGEADYNKFFKTGSSEAKLYTKFEDDGDKGTTGIQKITIEADGEVVSTNENVYNLNGQLVSTEGLGGLQKGIYILNGKKFIVK